MAKYKPISTALEGHYSASLMSLRKALRRRVIANFYPVTWDQLSPEQRRIRAHQIDYQNDPATKPSRDFWWNLVVHTDEVEQRLANWKSIAAPTAIELKTKEDQIKALNDELAHLQRMDEVLTRRGYPKYMAALNENLPVLKPDDVFFAFPKALARLKVRFDTTPEEVAAWIDLGPDAGGIAGYYDPWGREAGARFLFSPQMSEDYVAELDRCFFLEADLETFEPSDRFITGRALAQRWMALSVPDWNKAIQLNVSAGRLTDLHPTRGVTNVTDTPLADRPHWGTGLFSLNEIAKIEEALGIVPNVDLTNVTVIEADSPSERRQSIRASYDKEVKTKGKRGAISRLAKKLGLSRQRVSQLLKGR